MISYTFLIVHLVLSGLFNLNQIECNKYFDNKLNAYIYTYVDNMPEFPGGQLYLARFFAKNYNPQNQEVIQATFFIEFIINKDGKVTNPQFINKKDDKLTLAENEVLRVLKNMPDWKPGSCQGSVVPVKIKMPLRF